MKTNTNRYGSHLKSAWRSKFNVVISPVVKTEEGISSVRILLKGNEARFMRRYIDDANLVGIDKGWSSPKNANMWDSMFGKYPYFFRFKADKIQAKNLSPLVRNLIYYRKIAPFLKYGPPLLGIAAGLAASNIAGHVFQGILKATDYVRKVQDQVSGLEFGGIGPGFLTREAETERKRLQMAMDSSDSSGRYNLGREASLLAGTI